MMSRPARRVDVFGVPTGQAISAALALVLLLIAYTLSGLPRLVERGLGAMTGQVVNLVVAAATAVTVGRLLIVPQLRAPLEAEKRKADALLDSVADALIVFDESGTIQAYNRAATRTFGYGSREVLGQAVSLLLPGHESDLRPGSLLGEGDREIEGRRKDGRLFPMEMVVTPVRIAGQLTFVVVVRDLSKRKQDEEALRFSERRFRALTEGAADLSLILDDAGVVRFASAASTRLLGHGPDDLIGRAWTDLVSTEDHGQAAALVGRHLCPGGANHCPAIPIRLVNREGHTVSVEATARDFRAEAAIGGIVLNLHDLSTRIRTNGAGVSPPAG